MRKRARMVALGCAAIAACTGPTATAFAATVDDTETQAFPRPPETAQEKLAWVREFGLAHVAKAFVIARSGQATDLRLKVQLPRCWRPVAAWVVEERGIAYTTVHAQPGRGCTIKKEATLKTRSWVIRVSADVTHVADITGEMVAQNIR